jgi:hypothetical protein
VSLSSPFIYPEPAVPIPSHTVGRRGWFFSVPLPLLGSSRRYHIPGMVERRGREEGAVGVAGDKGGWEGEDG